VRRVVVGLDPIDMDVLVDVLEERPVELVLGDGARTRIEAAREVIAAAAAGDAPVYGVNTGFGKMATVRVAGEDLAELQTNLLRSHACGVGEPLPRGIVRVALLLRIANLAAGASGVGAGLVDLLIGVFNAGLVPVVPSVGSVGASGDLAPLAHMALVAIGEGEVLPPGADGPRPAAAALAGAGLEPRRLLPKEGLALINGTQVSTALAVAALAAADRLARSADAIAATTLEALKGSVAPFDARIHDLRPHAGQRRVADNFRRLLAGSGVVESHRGCARVQDNYSLRCVPQVHGASRDWFAFVRGA